jgi:hypothetical protein
MRSLSDKAVYRQSDWRGPAFGDCQILSDFSSLMRDWSAFGSQPSSGPVACLPMPWILLRAPCRIRTECRMIRATPCNIPISSDGLPGVWTAIAQQGEIL